MQFFYNVFGGHMPFYGPLTPLFWISGDVSTRFQSQSEQPYSHLVEASVMNIPSDSLLV